jgi:beta-glucosidase
MYFANAPKRQPENERRSEGPALSAAGPPEEPAQKPWKSSNEPWPTTDLKKLVAAGTVSEDTITRAAGRVLFEMDRFGFLDGKNKLEVTQSDNTEDVKIVEKTAIDAAVLLKNDGATLPLKAADLESLAMIGPGAAQTVAVGLTGEKAVGLPALEVGPLVSLQQFAGSAAHVTYVPADDMQGVAIPGQYLSHFGEPGLERRVF